MNVVLRKEVKYILDKVTYYQLSHILNQVLKPDIHNQKDGYLVRSLYFDTLNDKDFQDKEDGVYERRKIRLRVYNPQDDFAFLEIKQKTGDKQ